MYSWNKIVFVFNPIKRTVKIIWEKKSFDIGLLLSVYLIKDQTLLKAIISASWNEKVWIFSLKKMFLLWWSDQCKDISLMPCRRVGCERLGKITKTSILLTGLRTWKKNPNSIFSTLSSSNNILVSDTQFQLRIF